MANSQSSAAWAGGATAKPVARTSAAQVLRKSATPARRVALRAPRAGRPAPITSRLHDVEPELEGIEGSDQRLQLRLISLHLDITRVHRFRQRGLLEDDLVQGIARQRYRKSVV